MIIDVNLSGINELDEKLDQVHQKFCELRTAVGEVHNTLLQLRLTLNDHEESKHCICKCGKERHCGDAVFCSACGKKLINQPTDDTWG